MLVTEMSNVLAPRVFLLNKTKIADKHKSSQNSHKK